MLTSSFSFNFNFSFNFQIHQNNWNTFPVPTVLQLENNENYPSETQQKQLSRQEGKTTRQYSLLQYRQIRKNYL